MSNLQLSLPLGSCSIQEEPFELVWPEAAALAAEHFLEVDGGIEPKRKFDPDVPKMRALNVLGLMRVFTARSPSGELVGYLTWMISEDLESKGLLIAHQGAWFVRASAKSTNLGSRMFELSLVSLKLLGVKCLFPHHRLQGRGTRLSRFFERWGGKEIQRTFCLWIGD